MAGEQNKPGTPGAPGADLSNQNPVTGNPPPASDANQPPAVDGAKQNVDANIESKQQRIERLATSIESGNTSAAVVAELREIAKEVK